MVEAEFICLSGAREAEGRPSETSLILEQKFLVF